MDDKTPADAIPFGLSLTRQVGLDGKLFRLPSPSAFLPLMESCPVGVTAASYLAALFSSVLMGVVGLFPSGVPWSEVVQTAEQAGWSHEALDYAVNGLTERGILVGPHMADGVEQIELGPSFPHEVFRPMIDAAMPDALKQ